MKKQIEIELNIKMKKIIINLPNNVTQKEEMNLFNNIICNDLLFKEILEKNITTWNNSIIAGFSIKNIIS